MTDEEQLAEIKEKIELKQDDTFSLREAYKVLGGIINEKPDLAPQAFSIFAESVKSEKNNADSLDNAYEVLGEIIENKPELSAQVFSLLLDISDHLRLEVSISLFAKCLKNCRAQDFIVPDYLQDKVAAAQKLRYSRQEELQYALGKMSLKQVSDYNLGAQQRSLNILVGLAAVEGGISAEETKQFRQGTSSEMEYFYSQEKDWLVPASFKAAEIFGSWLPNYMDKVRGYFSVHDAVYWLPEGMSKAKNNSFSFFLRNNVVYDKQGEKLARPLEELSLIARNWRGLKPEQEKLPYKDLLAVCLSNKYENQKYDQFALQAAKFVIELRIMRILRRFTEPV